METSDEGFAGGSHYYEREAAMSLTTDRFLSMIAISLVAGAAVFVTACGSEKAATIGTPDPAIEGPIAGDPTLQSTAFDLATVGYQQGEYFVSGKARNFINSNPLQNDGKWSVSVAGDADFKTRIVAYRPIDPSAFNGTVIIEWLNVSGGTDAAVDWVMTHNELLRKGYAWVGVSAQKAGIDGGGLNLTGLSVYLKAVNPQRYAPLVHPGDGYAFDMYSQAAQAVLHPRDIDPLGGLHIQRAIAVGESQSAFYMLTYVDAIAPTAKLFDGYFIHSRGHGSAKLSQPPLADVAMPATVQVRDDLGLPVMMVQTETDLFVLGSYPDRQPDGTKFRLWEIAGTAHADVYTVQGAADRGTDPNVAAVVEITAPIPGLLDCGTPINSGPQHFVVTAAIAGLDNWLRTGVAPAHADRLEIAGDPPAFARDSVGNVVGGVRTSYVDAPIAVLSGEGQTASLLCSLFGTTKLLSSAALATAYPDHANYVAAVNASVAAALGGGFLLQSDGDLIKAWAQASSVGTP
jgi:hypothetical protein